MEITAQIVTGIKYQTILKCNLTEVSIENFSINSSKSSCIISAGQNRLAVSKWVSPKRTRSYPYERVYNTFSVSKRITVIPVVKDKGAAGDRDFLQSDTISLMSLLDIYVITAYYETAEKHRGRQGKITNQKFADDFIKGKIDEIFNYHSSALHWNLKELKGISSVLEKARKSYKEIAEKTETAFHNERGLESFAASIAENLSDFMESSRLKAQSAQAREFLTFQPKEILATQTKAKITITNYLGGKYFFTVDEILIKDGKLLLIESKHSRNAKIPAIGDIKDGLLKMMLYTNLENVMIDGKSLASAPVLKLTSEKIEGEISVNSIAESKAQFWRVNKFNRNQIGLMESLFAEAAANDFVVSLGRM